MESRIIDLETKSAYQEHLMQELNEVIIAQQQQIDGLEKALLHLKDFVQSDGEAQLLVEQESPPPHY